MTYKQYLTDLCLEWIFKAISSDHPRVLTEALGMGGVVYCEEFIGSMYS